MHVCSTAYCKADAHTCCFFDVLVAGVQRVWAVREQAQPGTAARAVRGIQPHEAEDSAQEDGVCAKLDHATHLATWLGKVALLLFPATVHF